MFANYTKIADNAITNSKIQDDSIDSRKIIAGSILGTDIAINQIGVNHLTGTAYLELVTAQAENSINSSHIVNGSITGTDIAGTTITGSNIVNATITYDKLNSNITSLITNSNISRNLLAITSVGDFILIPVDLVNNDYVDVEATIRFNTTFSGGNRLWSLFYNGSSFYNWKFWRFTDQPPYANPWIDTNYLGMTMYDMENSNYWGASNVRIRIYRGEVATTIADTRLYTVEGEARYGRLGVGPIQNTFWGSIEYRPTHVYLYVPSGCTFSSRYYVTNYK